MISKLLSKVWAFVAAIWLFALAIFTAHRSGAKAKETEIKSETEKAAREYTQAGYEAGYIGLQREQEAKNEKIDTVKRDHFS